MEDLIVTKKENLLKAIRFEQPDYIPMTFAINNSCWQSYDQNALLDLMEDHKLLFPDFKRPKLPYNPTFHPVSVKGKPYVDDFGCVWETVCDGITGTVTKHPLYDISKLDTYVPPNPNVSMGIGPIDWQNEERAFANARKNNEICIAGLRHGHTFLQLCDIRGYENLLFNMADDEYYLYKLIDMLEQFNFEIVKRYIAMKPDIMCYPEDLGMQIGPMLSPDYFRKYIKPSYQRLMKPARDNGIIVHMHSDGDLHDLLDDIIDGGVDIINLQDLVNGVDWIKDRFAGKTCIDLDIDRQLITPFGTPKQIDALIREEVEKLGCKAGGLMMIFGLYPGTPIENVKAVMDAMERYSVYYR